METYKHISIETCKHKNIEACKHKTHNRLQSFRTKRFDFQANNSKKSPMFVYVYMLTCLCAPLPLLTCLYVYMLTCFYPTRRLRKNQKEWGVLFIPHPSFYIFPRCQFSAPASFSTASLPEIHGVDRLAYYSLEFPRLSCNQH